MKLSYTRWLVHNFSVNVVIGSYCSLVLALESYL